MNTTTQHSGPENQSIPNKTCMCSMFCPLWYHIKPVAWCNCAWLWFAELKDESRNVELGRCCRESLPSDPAHANIKWVAEREKERERACVTSQWREREWRLLLQHEKGGRCGFHFIFLFHITPISYAFKMHLQFSRHHLTFSVWGSSSKLVCLTIQSRVFSWVAHECTHCSTISSGCHDSFEGNFFKVIFSLNVCTKCWDFSWLTAYIICISIMTQIDELPVIVRWNDAHTDTDPIKIEE